EGRALVGRSAVLGLRLLLLALLLGGLGTLGASFGLGLGLRFPLCRLRLGRLLLLATATTLLRGGLPGSGGLTGLGSLVRRGRFVLSGLVCLGDLFRRGGILGGRGFVLGGHGSSLGGRRGRGSGLRRGALGCLRHRRIGRSGGRLDVHNSSFRLL